MRFAGSLTQVDFFGSGCSVTASQGWALLWQALSRNASTAPTGAAALPRAADILPL